MRRSALLAALVALLPFTLAACASSGGGSGPHKQIITADGSPANLFAPIVRTGDLLFLSGVIGRGETIEIGTRQALEGIRTRLATANATMDDLVKCTVFMIDMAHYQGMNEVYLEYFPTNPPARSAIAVRALPANAIVEIECIGAVR